MNRFKSNKGISLASVLVTVVIMIIILTSIIYSRGQTNEVKKAMLLNSDIEELTKKVEVYYLEKQTLPMLEDSSSAFKYIEEGETADDKTPVYYKLQISLLDNLTLNNKEIIYKEEKNERTPGDQWYVINKETHTIYFVKDENGKVVPQEAKYSSEYDSIIIGATEGDNKIKFNQSEATSTQVSEETTIVPAEDKIIEDTSGLGVGRVEGENGTNTSPEEISGSGNIHKVYDYVGYSPEYNWNKVGDASSILVLHYDGEMNVYDDRRKLFYHDNSTKTWSDLSGHGYDGTIVKNSSWKMKCVDASTNSTLLFDNRTSTGTTSTWENDNSLYLKSNDYVLHRFITNNNGNATYNANVIPKGSDSFSMEIVFNMDTSSSKSKALIGSGFYNNNDSNSGIMVGDSFKKAGDALEGDSYGGTTEHKARKKFIESWKNNSNKAYDVLNFAYTKLYKNIGFNDIKVPWEIDAYVYYYSPAVYRGYPKLIQDETSNNTSRALYLINNNYLRTEFWGNDDNKSGLNIKDGKHTLSVTYYNDSKELKMYIDGEKVYTNTKSIAPNTIIPEVTVGAINYGLTILNEVVAGYNASLQYEYKEFLNNKVYSVRIYNKALSETEITHNYNLDRQRFKF